MGVVKAGREWWHRDETGAPLEAVCDVCEATIGAWDDGDEGGVYEWWESSVDDALCDRCFAQVEVGV